MNARILIPLALAVAGGSQAGCSHLDPDRVEADFGASNRAMLAGQYFDPEAARNPSTVPPTGMSGEKAEGVLQEYREDNADRQLDEGNIQLNTLTSGGG